MRLSDWRDGQVLQVPAVEMPRDAPARSGFVDEAQHRSVARRLRPDLRVVVAIAFTFGWRVRSEVLSLERRHVDLKAGLLRLDPGATKNKDGRVVYLTPELQALVAEQLARVDALGARLAKERQLDHVIVPYLFPHLAGPHRGGRIEEFRRRGGRPLSKPDYRACWCTTSAARRCGGWSRPGCRGRWR